MRSGQSAMQNEHYDVVIVNTHPIQYFAPLYQELSSIWRENFCVVYASKRGVLDAVDTEFESSFRWDIDLLSGYEHLFIDEADYNATKATPDICCASLSGYLDSLAPNAIIIHGYSDPAARVAILWAKKSKCPILMRGDTWTGAGERSGWLRRRLKRLWLKRFLVPYVTTFFAVGKRNAAYWRELGVKDGAIQMLPYAIDAKRFFPCQNTSDRTFIRKRYGLSEDANIIGYLGKFVEKKGIVALLEALASVIPPSRDVEFMLVGDGPLRDKIEAISSTFPVKIHLLGFRNQNEMPELYRAADLIVVPSIKEETWGFVVQEALACGVPVLVSEAVGCGPDLISNGINGWILPTGAWNQWAEFVCDWLTGKHDVDTELLRRKATEILDLKRSASAFVGLRCFSNPLRGQILP